MNQKNLFCVAAAALATICLSLLAFTSQCVAEEPSPPKNLIDAVRYNNYEAAVQFLNDGADVNATVYPKDTALHLAVHRDIKFVQLLIDHDADVNVQNHRGRTPLASAASSGKAEIIRLLIKHGAKVDTKGIGDHTTPLYMAVLMGHLEVVKILVAAGADVNAMSMALSTPLDTARSKGFKEIEEFLLQHEAKPGRDLRPR